VNNNAKRFPVKDLPSAKSGAKLQKINEITKYPTEKFENPKKKTKFAPTNYTKQYEKVNYPLHFTPYGDMFYECQEA
jgi:hypothetical protein